MNRVVKFGETLKNKSVNWTFINRTLSLMRESRWTLGTRMLVAGGLVLTVALILAGIDSWRAIRRPTPEKMGQTLKVLEFSSSLRSREFSTSQLLTLRSDPELVHPDFALPRKLAVTSESVENSRTGARFAKWLAIERDCDLLTLSQMKVADANFVKWRRWIETVCAKPLPAASVLIDFFKSPPLLHPLGGSWSRYVRGRSPASYLADENFVSELSRSLHLLEDSTPVNGIDFSSFQPSELQALIDTRKRFWSMRSNGDFWLKTETAPGRESRLIIVAGETLSSWLADLGFVFELSPGCGHADVDADLAFARCLRPMTDTVSTVTRSQGLVLIAGLAVLILGIIMLTNEQLQIRVADDRHRRLVLQTLSHELRHPATSLQLSLEVLRDRYDDLPEDAQTESLRMLDQVQRLRRILEASRQYLESASDSRGSFRFEAHRIDDMAEFVRATVEPYAEKIEFHCEQTEFQATALDRYWFGMCVTNLVKNALVHGARPIRVVVRQNDSVNTVEVFDSGSSPTLSFDEMIKPLSKGRNSPGMGLGLSLVHQLMGLMGGRLRFTASPKSFVLELPLVKPSVAEKGVRT